MRTFRAIPPNTSDRGRPAEPADRAASANRQVRAVALCGPIAPAGQPAAGGYEAANRRTADALARLGVAVWELPYPRARRAKALAYAWRFATLAVRLLTGRHRYDLLHFTPLNQRFAWAEHVLVRCAALAGRPVMVDVRAGTFVRYYGAAGPTYQRLVDDTLGRATQVAVEGRPYLDFVGERHPGAPLHLPNYVEAACLRDDGLRELPRPGRPVRLLYVGRVVREKGIDTLLEAAHALGLLGWTVEVDVIGDGPANDLAAWQSARRDFVVRWHGALAPLAMQPVVAAAHFFVFASRHDGEGHANALNEAMAAGVVPVCSDQGFSADVVGNTGVVLPRKSDGSTYAHAMDALLLDGRWPRLSQDARERVRQYFSEEAVLPALLAIYRSMLALHR